ncbi:hypothetical protein J8TS2_03430 [Lederbergia ruris]|uniref:DUF1642 domain-containing protein n=1 Tax=Lederbergia ruris TaxID=217495 RepID=A0ABQ4KF03_9BACI|nr:UPF0158 family protein [Lederbergia ruris]GIN56024.1 hypothetical protein J8TS2_03430 [Lederbergia ruris]
MKAKVNLRDIIDGMEMQFDEWNTYLNRSTGEVLSVSQNDLRAAEEDEPIDHLPDWQQEDLKIAIDVVENFENYVELPTKYDINEYQMMEDFCYVLSDGNKKNKLLNAIRGRGAFRRFKDLVFQLDLEEEWYTFRDNAYKEIAIRWCQDYDLEYK